MERTEEAERFFAELRANPWLATVHEHARHMFGHGYEQAIRDLVRDGLISAEVGYERSDWHEIKQRTEEWLVEQQARNEQAMAQWIRMSKLVTDVRV